MASFTTRIELHSAIPSDYDLLHGEMKKEGFTRTIFSGDKIEYDLPTAEYNKVGNYTRDQIMESAKKAATTTRKHYSILITESIGRSWYNLTPTKS